MSSVSLQNRSPKSSAQSAAAKSSSQTKQSLARLKALEMAMKRHQYRADALIEVLHKAQDSFGYLDEEVLLYIARSLKLPLSRVYGVATFYHLFTLKPGGDCTCVVCLGTTCHVKGGSELMAALEIELGIHMGETTADGKVSLVAARCLGACGIAPVMAIDGEVGGKQTAEVAIANLKAAIAKKP